MLPHPGSNGAKQTGRAKPQFPLRDQIDFMQPLSDGNTRRERRQAFEIRLSELERVWYIGTKVQRGADPCMLIDFEHNNIRALLR